MIWFRSPLAQWHEACSQFQDSMMTATGSEREFLSMAGIVRVR